MDEKKQEKIFPYVGQGYKLSHFEQSSPWKKANTAFNWTNFEYPLYHGHHAHWEILIVLSDCIQHKINGTEKLLSVGEACLIGPKDKHSLLYPNGIKNQFQAVNLLAKDSYIQALLGMYSPTLYEEVSKDPTPLYFSLSPNFLEKCTTSLLEIQTFENQSTPYTEQQCNIIFSNILLKFLEQRQSAFGIPSILKPFIQQLNNPLITNEQIKNAQHNLPYSYPQLTRIFKKYMHCTITQYTNRAKLQYAKELLANTDMSLTEITNELNFESPSYFHKMFKKHFNITPGKYKKLNSLPNTQNT